ncbi:MAG: hypothetical protein O7B35_06320 [Deltaproteobacteria bacterium]|nr:hypothetical protein [Deltaproteobacteria bacterium]
MFQESAKLALDVAPVALLAVSYYIALLHETFNFPGAHFPTRRDKVGIPRQIAVYIPGDLQTT